MEPDSNDQLTVKLVNKFKPQFKKVSVKCGNKKFLIPLPPHPLFPLVEEITLSTSCDYQCLKLIADGQLQIQVSNYKKVIEACREKFNAEIFVDTNFLMMKMFLGEEEQSAENLMILEDIEFADAMKIFNQAYDMLNVKLHRKINRKLKRYISISKRSEREKTLLDSLFKEMKEMKEISPEKRQTNEKEQEKNQPVEEKKKRQFPQKNKKNSDGQFYQRKSVSKEKIDQRIYLGINGDTEEGWRQRYRPPKIPQKPAKAQNAEKTQKVQKVQKVKRAEKDATQKVPAVSSSEPLSRIFTFPKDGKTYDFNKIIDKTFMILVNGSFWVRYDGKDLTITKDGKGYMRPTDIETMQNNKGFIAEGLTINLDGLSNLEDGGLPIGDPKVEEIISSENQWFNIVTLEIFI